MSNEGEGGSLDFLEPFSELEDPRQRAKVLYPLDEVLLLTLCAVLSGAEGWVAVGLFGQKKLEFLRRFLPFAQGTPSHPSAKPAFSSPPSPPTLNISPMRSAAIGGLKRDDECRIRKKNAPANFTMQIIRT